MKSIVFGEIIMKKINMKSIVFGEIIMKKISEKNEKKVRVYRDFDGRYLRPDGCCAC